MKVLIINHDWFAEELRLMGHEVMTMGTLYPVGGHQVPRLLMPVQDLVRNMPGGFTPDRIVYLDNSAPVMLAGFEHLEIPALFYSVDAHHHAATHKFVSHLFDHTLLAQPDFAPHFESVGITPEWMPLWASRVTEPRQEKEHGAVFVGTLSKKLNAERVAFFEELQKRVSMLCTQGDWGEIFPRSKIVVNQTVKGDLNFRVFEAMVSGALLLTEQSPNGLLDIFKPDEHLVLYPKGDVAEAARKIEFYLTNESERQRIANAGRAEIVAKHLPIHRAKRIEEILLGLTKKPRSSMRYSAAFANMASVAWRMNVVDSGLCAYALSIAMQPLHSAYEANESFSDELSYLAVVTTVRFSERVEGSSAHELIKLLADRHPDLIALELSTIRHLLNTGARAEAEARAAKIVGLRDHGAAPEEIPVETVFNQAEQLVRTLMMQLWPER